MKRSALSNMRIVVFSAAAVLVLGLMVFLASQANIEISGSRSDGMLTRVRNASVQIVKDEQAPIGLVWEYRFRLGEALSHDTNLAFLVSHQYVDIYLDGEHVYSLRPSEELSEVKTVGSNWVSVPLYREDAGKEILVVLTPVYENYSGRAVEFLVGPAVTVYRTQLLQSLPELLLSLANIAVGTVMVCAALYYLFKKNSGSDIFASGLLGLSVGLWRLADTDFLSLLFRQKTIFLYSMSVSMLTALVILLAMSTKTQFRAGGRRIMEIGGTAAVLVFIAQLLLQALGIMDLRETLSLTHSMIVLCALLIIGLSVYEGIRYSKEKQPRRFPYTAWILSLGALVDLILYYVRGSSSGLIFIQVAILCFVTIEGMRFLYSFITQEQRLAEKELQLTQSRSITLMSQIRSHFVFNILNAISGMCKYDPEKADETVVRFAHYLRSNIDIMQEDKPIAFHAALRHLEDYVVLEQIRFGDKIQFETDIQEEHFMLPPLVLQPLVENAIKHGLTPKASGGTITLSTRAEGDSIQITVADDGVGFDPRMPQRSGAVGLNNIRFRLEYMAKGTMKIESAPGQGTRVTLTIPRKEAELCE